MDLFGKPPGKPELVEVKCPNCNGTGKKDGDTCKSYHSTDKIKTS